MLIFTFDSEHKILIIRPQGELCEADFAKLAASVDPIIDEIGTLNGVLIDALEFAGWQDFDSLVSHLKFVSEHHTKVKRVAAVTDDNLLRIMPALITHFVAAEVRHFAQSQKQQALTWLSEPQPPESRADSSALRFRQIEGQPIFWIEVSGKVTAAEYRQLLAQFEKALTEGQSLSFLIKFSCFDGAEVAALWEDFKFGIEHFKQMKRIALVGDEAWLDWLAAVAKPFDGLTVKHFHLQQEPEAWVWLCQEA